jgi:glycosyltransferase involved in cell wall biosynthesis
MNKHSRLVSVIIPVYNCEKYLGQAIESVLAQTYRQVEIIVVDDGSTDGTADVARRFATVKYHFQPNQGIGASRNRGIDLANGGFFGFLDADDIWVNNKLLYQMRAFDETTELDMVFGHTQQFLSPYLDNKVKAKLELNDEIMPGYVAGALLIKRKSFFRAGYFSTNWRVGEFIDWYLKAMEVGLKSFMVPEVLMKRRIHNDNIGTRERDSRTDYVRILKASLDRRRKGNLN